MNVIGQTSSGSLIIEMTNEEYLTVYSGATSSPPSNVPQDIQRWAEIFRRDLRKLKLSTKTEGTLARFLYLYGTSEGSWRHEMVSRERADVFTHNGRYLDFEQWVSVVQERRPELVAAYQLGPKMADEILQAADAYLSEKAQA